MSIDVRRVEQLLGRNAAAQETGSAKILVTLDDRCLQSDLGRPDRGNIAAWSGPDNRHVELLCHLPPFELASTVTPVTRSAQS
jgi:hypothetical protein